MPSPAGARLLCGSRAGRRHERVAGEPARSRGNRAASSVHPKTAEVRPYSRSPRPARALEVVARAVVGAPAVSGVAPVSGSRMPYAPHGCRSPRPPTETGLPSMGAQGRRPTPPERGSTRRTARTPGRRRHAALAGSATPPIPTLPRVRVRRNGPFPSRPGYRCPRRRGSATIAHHKACAPAHPRAIELGEVDRRYLVRRCSAHAAGEARGRPRRRRSALRACNIACPGCDTDFSPDGATRGRRRNSSQTTRTSHRQPTPARDSSPAARPTRSGTRRVRPAIRGAGFRVNMSQTHQRPAGPGDWLRPFSPKPAAPPSGLASPTRFQRRGQGVTRRHRRKRPCRIELSPRAWR